MNSVQPVFFYLKGSLHIVDCLAAIFIAKIKLHKANIV